MTPEEEDEFAARLDVLMALPERIDAVGGPYCGSVLFPQREVVTSVANITDDGRIQAAPRSDALPHNFFPESEDLILFFGAYGTAAYRMGADNVWRYDWALSDEHSL